MGTSFLALDACGRVFPYTSIKSLKKPKKTKKTLKKHSWSQTKKEGRRFFPNSIKIVCC